MVRFVINLRKAEQLGLFGPRDHSKGPMFPRPAAPAQHATKWIRVPAFQRKDGTTTKAHMRRVVEGQHHYEPPGGPRGASQEPKMDTPKPITVADLIPDGTTLNRADKRNPAWFSLPTGITHDGNRSPNVAKVFPPGITIDGVPVKSVQSNGWLTMADGRILNPLAIRSSIVAPAAPASPAPAPVESTTGLAIDETARTYRIEIPKLDPYGHGEFDGPPVPWQGRMTRADADALFARLPAKTRAASRIVEEGPGSGPAAPLELTRGDGSPDGMGQFPDAAQPAPAPAPADAITSPEELAAMIGAMDGVVSARPWQGRRVYVEPANLNGKSGRAPFHVDLAAGTVVPEHGGWYGARTRDAALEIIERVKALLPRYVHTPATPPPDLRPPAPAELRTVTETVNGVVSHVPVVVTVDEDQSGTWTVHRPTGSGYELTTKNPHVHDLHALLTTHGATVTPDPNPLPGRVPRKSPTFASREAAAAFARAAVADGFLVAGVDQGGKDLENTTPPHVLINLTGFRTPGKQGTPLPESTAAAPTAGVVHAGTFRKLRDGSWGAAVKNTTKPSPGDTVHVTTRAGETKVHKVRHVVSSFEDGTHLVSLS